MLHDKTVELKRRVVEFLEKNTPITANGKSVFIENITIEDPPELNSIEKQLQMKYLSREEILQGKGSLIGHVGGIIILKDDKGNVLSKTQPIKDLFSIPYMTNRETYIINGGEKVIINQMRTKPGVFTAKSAQQNTVKTKMTFDNSVSAGQYTPQMYMKYVPDTSEFKIEIKRGKTKEEFNGINFLREIGLNDTEIRTIMGNGSHADLVFEKSGNRRGKSIYDIYKHITGHGTSGTENPELIRQKLFDYTKENAKFGTGTNVVKDNLGTRSNFLSKEVLAKAVSKTFGVAIGTHEADDEDDLRYKDVLGDNDFIMSEIEKDFLDFKKEAMRLLETKDKITANNINTAARGFGSSLNKFMSTGSVVQAPEQINPLYVASNDRKITQLGTGGISNENAITEGARNLAKNSFGRIDPIETPESGKIGVVEHLSQSAVIKNGTIYAPVLKVKNGVATDDDAHVVELSPDDDFDSKIAFYDTRCIERQGNKLKFLTEEVPARYQGKMLNLPIDEIQYVDRKPQNIMGYASNLIPFVSHDDGNRALMGANMQKQSILLKNRETPLVTPAMDAEKKKTYNDFIGEKFGVPIKANVDGIVEKVTDGKITVKDTDGASHTFEYYHYFPFNQGFIHNEVTVKPGQAVKKGDMLAEGWQTKDGSLALGVNTRIAFMPYKGYNYEDGMVVSQSYADKMVTEEMQTLDIDITDAHIGGKGSGLQKELPKHTTRQEVFENLDRDGIIKVGQYIKPGSIVVSRLRDTRYNSDDAMDAIRAKKRDSTGLKHDPYVIPSNSYLEGQVVRVNTLDRPEPGVKQRIVITFVNSKPLKKGDKLSGRHGNKGTITLVLPDNEMPVAADGKSFDVLLSPLGIPSRKNVGQLYEAHAGIIAEKTGQPFIVNNFDHTEKDRVINGLKEIGMPDGKMKVYLREKDSETGEIKTIETENPVTVGNMYMMKLKHKVDDKIQARSNIETPVKRKTYVPSKVVGGKQGEKHNPQSLGEMEMRALQAHGAVFNILENSTFKSDGGGDAATRTAIFNAIGTGKFDNLDMPATPETLKVMSDHLKALGLKTTPLFNGKDVKSLDDPFDSMKLTPMKPTEVLKTVGKENIVTDYNIYDAKDKAEKDTVIKGGLFDEKIFGKEDDLESRTKWGYIKLTTPVPNPVLLNDGKRTGYNPYEALTKLKSEDIVQLVEGKKVLIMDPEKFTGFDDMDADGKALLIAQYKDNMAKADLKPGQLVDPKRVEEAISATGRVFWKAGGEALQYLLDNVDIDKRIEEAKSELDSARSSEINKKYKQYKQLLSLKENKTSPSDLMIHYLPVVPTHLRPIVKEGQNVVRDDLNGLYQNIIYTSNNMAKTYADGLNMQMYSNPSTAAIAAANLYRKVTDLSGHTEGKDRRTKKTLEGIKTVLGRKEGLIRGEMLSKRVDFSGRSVIGVDPTLNVNEIGLPVDMARYVYRPFILNELLKQGKAKNLTDAKKIWEKPNNPVVVQIIKEIAEDRPVIANRQPTLHKFGVQAFKPVIMGGTRDEHVVRNIQLNPLVVTGFNADFDGDTMALHVPVTEKAKEEAKKLMLPSQNLINPTNGSIIFEIRHEMALGIYYLTVDSDKPKGAPVNYASRERLFKDYMEGKINARQAVNIAGHQNVTAGSAMFNLLIPEAYRDKTFKKTWASKDIQNMFRKMYEDAEAGNGISKMEISRYMDKIKDLGFQASTRSGVSLSIADFKKLDFSNIINSKIKEKRKEADSEEEALILGHKAAEEEIEKKLKAGGFLEPDNPIQIMMASGARAKADQIRRMMATVGVGMDINKKLTMPVTPSHLEGLAPHEYWLHSHDSRKGMADRSVSTQAPGALTREVWSAVQDMLIKEDDCDTHDGITLKASDPAILGRFLAQDKVIGGNGNIYAVYNQLITHEIRNNIYKDDTIKTVKVRSPLRCKTVGGICQKCYGTVPGTNQVPKLGTAVGVIASQAMGEPVMQMTMNTFHSGGTSSNATIGLPRVQQLLDLSEDHNNPAVLAKVTGTVTKIEQDKTKPYDVVYVDKTPHIIPHTMDNKSKPLRVKKDDVVTKGDFLTVGDVHDIDIAKDDENNKVLLTNATPETLFKLKQEAHGMEEALNYVKDYVAGSMQYSFNKTVGDGKLDRKHLETIVAKLGSKAIVMDPGDSSFLRGQDVDTNELERWNAEHTNPYNAKKVPLSSPNAIIGRTAVGTYKDKKGNVILADGKPVTSEAVGQLLLNGIKEIKILPKPIKYDAQILSKSKVISRGHTNWLSNTAVDDVFQHVARGAATGQIDKLNEPRTRVMTGKLLNVGEGYNITNNPKTKDTANSVSTKMLNFFTDPFDKK